MKWFQHSVDSHDDPDISDAWDEFGDAGVIVFWVLLELYGREFNSVDDEGNLILSKTFLRRKLRKSWTKAEQILNFYSERQRIVYSTDGKYISLNIPQFIEIASNWTKRPKHKNKQDLCSNSVATTAIEEEEEEEEKKIYKRKSLIPEDYKLTTEHIDYAKAKGITEGIADIFEGFCIHHKKQGNKYVDWNMAWQTWIRKKLEFDKQNYIAKAQEPDKEAQQERDEYLDKFTSEELRANRERIKAIGEKAVKKD